MSASLLLPLALLAAPEIKPSFDLTWSSWHATHIAVATEGGAVDGRLEVLEVLKGDLEVGEVVSLPALAEFADLGTSRIRQSIWDRVSGEPIDLPERVTGERMILFLQREVDPATGASTWRSTSIFEDWRTTVAWIEDGRSFGFVQYINPGPSELVRLGSTEAESRAGALQVAELRSELERIASLEDPAERARAAIEHVGSEIPYATHRAIEVLEGCGADAVPLLERALLDEANLRLSAGLIGALAEAGGEAAGPFLARLLEDELVFWRSRGPRLAAGWWNGSGLENAERQLCRDHYGRLARLLTEVGALRIDGAAPTVRALRALWAENDGLSDLGGDGRSGRDQMTRALEKAVEALQ